MRKIPDYQKIYQQLRHQIINGFYEAGDLIPSESKLKTIHMSSQPTVRKAVELLETEGLVKKHHGKGSIVQSRPIGVGIISFEGDLLTTQNDNSKIVTRVTREPEVIESLPDIFGFKSDHVEAENGFYYFERMRIVEGYVMFYEEICVPRQNLPRFRQINLHNKSFYEVLFKKYEIMTTASDQRFWAISANSDIASQLKIPQGAPVQRLQRRFSTNREHFHIYSNLTANTERICLFNTSK